ncbi:MAG: DUF6259 domain-containing protein [Phycisphaerae bacterium]
MSLIAQKKADHFLNEETEFHLGALPTEQSHPKTKHLSQVTQKDTEAGVRMVQSVDQDILPSLERVFSQEVFTRLVEAVTSTVQRGGKIFFAGCGATGRLSILLEAIWRRFWQQIRIDQPLLAAKLPNLEDRVISVMTAGDHALIRSVEGYEDYTSFGTCQLEQAGVQEGDTVVAITEGGETSFVIGAAWKGLEAGAKVFFVYNNPSDVLAKHVKRSRELIEEPRIGKLDLSTGPMAVAGSTRMQATTCELLVVGTALEMGLRNVLAKFLNEKQLDELGFPPADTRIYTKQFRELLDDLSKNDATNAIAQMVEFEEGLYQKGGLVTYMADEYLLDILTDTTERAPTFRLPPFRKCDDTTSPRSWAFIKNPTLPTAQAWLRMMRRHLRGIDWGEETYRRLNASVEIQRNHPRLDNTEILKFQIGNEDDSSRYDAPDSAAVMVLVGSEIRHLQPDDPFNKGFMTLATKFHRKAALYIGSERTRSDGLDILFRVPCRVADSPFGLWSRLAVKLVLNTVSTVTMARMEKLIGNLMVCVETTNKKLIDRGTRLVAQVVGLSYEDACHQLFETLENMDAYRKPGEQLPSPVAITIQRLQKTYVLFGEDGNGGVFDAIGHLKSLGTDGNAFFKIKPLSNWRLSINLSGESRMISADDMERLSVQQTGNKLALVWTGIAGVDSEASVSVRWRIGDGLLLGMIAYTKFHERCKVEKIHFPVVEFECDESGSLVIPHGLGLLLKNARRNISERPEAKRKHAWSYLNGGTMQFCAYLQDGAGLYFDCRDANSFIKSAEVAYGGGQTLTYVPTHPVPLDRRCPFEYEMPYESGVRQFHGGWHRAASIYKEWATRQKWYVARDAVSHSKDLDDIGIWCWNRGRCETVVPPVEQLAERSGVPVGLDWYWWHAKPYDCGYPNYFPPREGDKFKEAVAGLRTKGVFTQVYVNGVLWDMDDESWKEGGESSSIITADGNVLYFVFNKYLQHRLAYMCGTAEIFREKLLEIASNVEKLGLNGLYLDVIATHSNEPCHNPAHGHALGGGCYQVEGFRRLLSEMKSRYPKLSLSSESCGEAYLDLLDSGILLDPSRERLDSLLPPVDDFEIIPLFKAVYPDTVRLFGNYALVDGIPPYDELWPVDGKWTSEKDWQRLYPDQFFVEMSRNVVWGLQPTVANLRKEHFNNPRFKSEIDFLCLTARFYHENRDCLLYGTLLDPGELEVKQVEVNFLVRMIFTAEGKESTSKRVMPSVLHSVWRTRDGREAIILANYSSLPVSFKWYDKGRSLSGEIGPHKFMRMELC